MGEADPSARLETRRPLPTRYTYLLGTSTPVVTLPMLRKVPYDPAQFVPVGRFRASQ